MLIRNAEIFGIGRADLRIAGDRVVEIGTLADLGEEEIIHADGGGLLPGLHDHHIHLAALAAQGSSIFCGPPDVCDPAALAARLAVAGDGWLRATGYHESVAGMLDASYLDAIVPDRPLRVQHRGGRMWFLNSAAIAELLSRADPPPGLERIDGRYTGRLFDEDVWLRAALSSRLPTFDAVGRTLLRHGVTAITDMSPANDPTVAAHFAAERARGSLPQRVTFAGSLSLGNAPLPAGVALGPAKLHLHEAQLPDLDDAIHFIRQGHAQGRGTAVHCATEVELVFALAALEDAGVVAGDRIEHASVASDELVAEIARLGLEVCTQPHFIAERGEAYRADVAPQDWPHLYRLRAFLEAGVPLSAGSDAPFGRPDPWASIAAATRRSIGQAEELSREEAINLYIDTNIQNGMPADLVLLDRDWRDESAGVRATFIAGNRVYQAPA